MGAVFLFRLNFFLLLFGLEWTAALLLARSSRSIREREVRYISYRVSLEPELRFERDPHSTQGQTGAKKVESEEKYCSHVVCVWTGTFSADE